MHHNRCRLCPNDLDTITPHLPRAARKRGFQMCPREALHSEVFLTYFWMLLGLLVLAGLALAFFKWVLKRDVDSVWITYRSWLVMAPLIAVFLFAGRVPTIVALSLVAAFGFKEFARATGLYQD